MENLVRLSLACNQNCIFCNVRYQFKTKDTSEAKREILDTLKKDPRGTVSFTGGEPTIRKDLIELVAFAKKQGCGRVEVQTNAMMCYYESYVEGLKSAGLDGAFVALHSHLENVSDRITRTPGSFKLTLAGIENLLNASIPVTINTVINSMNYRFLPDFVKFIRGRFPHARGISFSFVQPFGNAQKNSWIVPRISGASPHIRKAMEYCKGNGVWFNNPYCGIPLCHARGFEEYCSEYQEVREREKSVTHEGIRRVIENKVKSANCKYCSLDKYCLGVWRWYADLYGLDELNPVKDEWPPPLTRLSSN